MLFTDWLSYSWLANMTDVTLVSDDTYWGLDWCYSSNWGSDESYQVMRVIKWWKLSSDESCQWWKLSSDESYQVVKVIKWWKLSSDESYQEMKVFMWWKLSSDESYQVMKAIKWWKLSSDESYQLMNVIKLSNTN